MLKEANFDFSQTISLGASNSDREKMAVIIQDCLKKIGVNVEIETGDATTLMSGARWFYRYVSVTVDDWSFANLSHDGLRNRRRYLLPRSGSEVL